MHIDRRTQRTGFFATSVFYILAAWLAGWRVFVALHAVDPALRPIAYIGAYLLFAMTLPLGIVLPRNRFSKALSVIGNYWTCFQITLFFAAAVEGVLSIVVVRLLHWVSPHTYAYAATAWYLAACAFTVFGIVNARRMRLTRYACRIDKPLPADRPCRIVHLSDLHLGSINDLRAVRRIAQRVNALHPDLVCITGDTFTESVREVFEYDDMQRELRGMRSKYGVYACLGNHDAGKALPDMLAFFRGANIRLLEDAYVEFDGITLLGRVDPTPGGVRGPERLSVSECLAGARPDNAVIVLDHQPGDIDGARAAGADLLLSGHTHGGQFYPINRMVRRAFPHYVGCRRFGRMYAIVSAGSGTAVPPMRVGSWAEIVEIELRGEA